MSSAGQLFVNYSSIICRGHVPNPSSAVNASNAPRARAPCQIPLDRSQHGHIHHPADSSESLPKSPTAVVWGSRSDDATRQAPQRAARGPRGPVGVRARMPGGELVRVKWAGWKPKGPSGRLRAGQPPWDSDFGGKRDRRLGRRRSTRPERCFLSATPLWLPRAVFPSRRHSSYYIGAASL